MRRVASRSSRRSGARTPRPPGLAGSPRTQQPPRPLDESRPASSSADPERRARGEPLPQDHDPTDHQRAAARSRARSAHTTDRSPRRYAAARNTKYATSTRPETIAEQPRPRARIGGWPCASQRERRERHQDDRRCRHRRRRDPQRIARGLEQDVPRGVEDRRDRDQGEGERSPRRESRVARPGVASRGARSARDVPARHPPGAERDPADRDHQAGDDPDRVPVARSSAGRGAWSAPAGGPSPAGRAAAPGGRPGT